MSLCAFFNWHRIIHLCQHLNCLEDWFNLFNKNSCTFSHNAEAVSSSMYAIYLLKLVFLIYQLQNVYQLFTNVPSLVHFLLMRSFNPFRPPDKSALLKIIFLFLDQNICCGYSKVLNSFEHPKHMFKLMDKKIITILH